MKLNFEQPIIEADVVRHSITIDHVIIYPDADEVVINNRDGSSRKMPLSGFPPESMKILDVLIAAFSTDVISEYVAGAVTARALEVAKAKLDQPDPIEITTIPEPPIIQTESIEKSLT